LTESLYYLSRDLGSAPDRQAILNGLVHNVEESLTARITVFLEEHERLDIVAGSSDLMLDQKEQAVADWAYRNRQPAGRGTETLGSALLIYLPLQAAEKTIGVLGIKLPGEADYRSEPTRRLLNAFCSQVALALERVEFTRQLEQAQLLRSRENLERALLNSISHDLRSPLATITGVLSSFRDGAGGLNEQSRHDLLENAWEEVGRLNRFVGNLLDMTRLEAGAVRPNLEPCDIEDLIGCAVAAFEHRLQGRQINILVPPDLPLVFLDMVLMTQVLINLLDNALKYSSADRPVTLLAKRDGHCLVLEVADQGPGVQEHELKWIFDKFYRVPVPEGVSGTGLGLSICKGFVEAHGGEIRAENRDGGGLRVIVTLPLDQGSSQRENNRDG
jgi:two-component system sensor histidine kinase KdpD